MNSNHLNTNTYVWQFDTFFIYFSVTSIAYPIQDAPSSPLTSFMNPINSLLKVFLQTVGETDATGILIDSQLIHPAAAFILVIIFIIAVPVLFNNFLVSQTKKNWRFALILTYVYSLKIGNAVGEAEDQRKKAQFTLNKAKVSCRNMWI